MTSWLIFPLWLALILYWVLAHGRAPNEPVRPRWIWWREIALRLGFFALVVLVLDIAAFCHLLPGAEPLAISRGPGLALTGSALAASGVALAIAARRSLGSPVADSSLGSPVPERAPASAPQPLTRGPYALVRHPLYGGLLLAMLGSALAQSSLWLLPLLVYLPAFIRSARREEQQLLQQFPEAYAAYRRRTKMLLPFVL